MRAAVAHDVSARMAYKGQTLREATESVVLQTLVKMGGTGGLIAVDRDGNIAMPFVSSGLKRAALSPDGTIVSAAF